MAASPPVSKYCPTCSVPSIYEFVTTQAVSRRFKDGETVSVEKLGFLCTRCGTLYVDVGGKVSSVQYVRDVGDRSHDLECLTVGYRPPSTTVNNSPAGAEGEQPRGEQLDEVTTFIEEGEQRRDPIDIEKIRAIIPLACAVPVPSPLPWMGGKSAMVDTILEIIPPHKVWVEVFSGGAWVTLGKDPSIREIINDINGVLVGFWEVVRDRLSDLLAWLEDRPRSRELFMRYREAIPTEEDPVVRAGMFFYVVSCAFNGGGPTNPSYSAHSDPRPMSVVGKGLDLNAVSARLSGVELERRDFRRIISLYDAPHTCMYLDPPYVGVGSRYYAYTMTETDHRDLASLLVGARSRWILSYGDHPLIRELYGGCHISAVETLYRSRQHNGGDQRTMELLITNFDPVELRDGCSPGYQSSLLGCGILVNNSGTCGKSSSIQEVNNTPEGPGSEQPSSIQGGGA